MKAQTVLDNLDKLAADARRGAVMVAELAVYLRALDDVRASLVAAAIPRPIRRQAQGAEGARGPLSAEQVLALQRRFSRER